MSRVPRVDHALQLLRELEVAGRHIVGLLLATSLSTVLRLSALVMFLPLVRALITGHSETLDRFRLFERVPGGLFTGAAVPLLIAGAIILAAILRAFLERRIQAWIAARETKVVAESQQRVVRRLLYAGRTYFERRRPANLANALQRWPKSLVRGVSLLRQTLGSVAEAVLYSLALVFLSWRLAGIGLAALVIFTVTYLRLVRVLERLDDEIEEAEDAVRGTATQVLEAYDLVELAGTQEVEAERIAQRARHQHWVLERRQQLQGLLQPASDLVAIVLLLGFAWFVSRFTGSESPAQVTRFIVFFLIFRRLVSTVQSGLRLPPQWRRISEAQKRIAELLDSAAPAVSSGGPKLWSAAPLGIEMRDLTFSYSGKRPALQLDHLELQPGQRTWLVGPTGSGKSTLISLLARQYECPAGSLSFDGVDADEYSTASLRAGTTLLRSVPQFLGETLREHVVYGLGQVDDSDLESALEASLAAEFVDELPDRLETVVSEPGRRFSTGQLQRLAIARVFLRPTRLLLLDEATSGLDAMSEAVVLARVSEYASRSVLVIATHRLGLIEPHDQVVFLQRSRLVEAGRFDELLQSRGPFFHFFGKAENKSQPP